MATVGSVVLFSQTDMQPPTIVPSGDVNDAKLSQPTARNLFANCENTQGLGAKSTLASVLVPFAHIEKIG